MKGSKSPAAAKRASTGWPSGRGGALGSSGGNGGRSSSGGKGGRGSSDGNGGASCRS